MNTYFDHKVIWITGASSGIGEALVNVLAVKSSARIILSSRHKEQLYTVAEKAGLDTSRFAVLPLDLADYKGMIDVTAEAVSKSERLIY
jgi:dehydrogenase/reductase SDR family protein 7B